MVLAVYAPNVWTAVPAMVVTGIAWLTVANTLSVAAQLSLPDWVRARGMATYQMAIMGGSALGAALWGQVAGLTDVRSSVVAAAVTGRCRWLPFRALAADRSDPTSVSLPIQ